MSPAGEERFLGIVRADPTVRAILERIPGLGLSDCWLTAGVLFQTVWNALTGRPAGTGIRDADLFYVSPDTSWEVEDAVIRAGADLFADLPVPVEIRNEARVHLRRQAPRHVYEAKTARWIRHWPELTGLDWADPAGLDGSAG